MFHTAKTNFFSSFFFTSSGLTNLLSSERESWHNHLPQLQIVPFHPHSSSSGFVTFLLPYFKLYLFPDCYDIRLLPHPVSLLICLHFCQNFTKQDLHPANLSNVSCSSVSRKSSDLWGPYVDPLTLDPTSLPCSFLRSPELLTALPS